MEIHIAQGEREMAADNKSLGRFKLTGIPPAPRGVPQIQVAFDIDANGILQVSALDRATGREQSITVQGASTLNEAEIQNAIRQADKFAETDRLRREKVDRRNRAEALAARAERELRSVALDFGLSFAQGTRRRVEALVRELRDSLARNDERGLDLASASLQDALYELTREVSEYSLEAKGEGFFDNIRRTIVGDDDPNYGFEERRPVRRGPPPDRISRMSRTNAYDEDWGDDDDWF